MTGNRVYDAYRVLSGARVVLGKTYELAQKELKLKAEASSVVRAIYESSPVFRLVFGNNYRANPRPHPHSHVIKRKLYGGPTIKGTIFDLEKRPTLDSTTSTTLGNKREYSYSSDQKVIGLEKKKEVINTI